MTDNEIISRHQAVIRKFQAIRTFEVMRQQNRGFYEVFGVKIPAVLTWSEQYKKDARNNRLTYPNPKYSN